MKLICLIKLLNYINQIICGDWSKVSPFLPDNSIHLLITDVPFGVNFKNSFFYDDSKDYVFSNAENWVCEMHRVLEKHCHCYIYIPTLELDKWISIIKKFFNYNNLINASTYTTNRYIKNNFPFDSQYIVYCSKLKAKNLNKIDWIETSSSWKKDKRNPHPKKFTYQYTSRIPKQYRANVKPNKQIKLFHPNEKNQELIAFLMLLSSNEEDIVLDCFCGSGSVPIVAKERKRLYCGVDSNKEWCRLTEARIKSTKVLKEYRLLSKPIIKKYSKQFSLNQFIEE